MYKKSMGKVLTNALCIGLAAAMITGCGTAKAEEGAAEAVTEESAEAASEELAADEPATKETPTVEENTQDDSDITIEDRVYEAYEVDVSPKDTKYEYETDNKVYIVDHDGDTYEDHVFCVDTQGKIIAHCSDSQVEAVFDENDNYFKPMGFLMEKDGIWYYECWETRDIGGIDKRAVFAIDIANCRIAKLFEFNSSTLLEKFDYFDGCFRAALDVNEGYTRRNDYYRITKEKDEFKYNIEQEYDYKYYWSRTKNDSQCYERTMGETGYIVSDDGTDYVIVDQKGKETVIHTPLEGDLVLETYDPQFVFFSERDVDRSILGLYYFDIASGKTVHLPIETGNLKNGLTYRNGSVYYVQADSTLYSFDIETREEKKLLTKDFEYSKYIIEDGKIFFAEYKDGKGKWYIADLNNVDATQTMLDFDAYIGAFETAKDRIAKYGKVTTLTGEGPCPHCGEVLGIANVDAFALDPAYSAQAEKINNRLMEYAKQRTDAIKGCNADISANFCGNHSLYYQHGWDTFTVDDVDIIYGRYLTVSECEQAQPEDSPAAWYKRQYLFDLQTGDELNIMSFYRGSEEDLKKLLATKVKENFEKYCADNSMEFSAEDAEEAYNVAYEDVDLQAVYFEEDEIKCYFIGDYRICPYNVDYFRIRVSYQELLGRDSL